MERAQQRNLYASYTLHTISSQADVSVVLLLGIKQTTTQFIINNTVHTQDRTSVATEVRKPLTSHRLIIQKCYIRWLNFVQYRLRAVVQRITCSDIHSMFRQSNVARHHTVQPINQL